MTGSEVPIRKYVGIDENDRVLEEVDGVLHTGGLPEGFSNFYDYMDSAADTADDGFRDQIVYESRNVDRNGPLVESEMADELGFTVIDDDDIDDHNESASNGHVVEEVFENAEEVNVGEVTGGLGNSVFRFGVDNTILVEDICETATAEPDIVEPKIGMEFEIGEEFIAYVHRYGQSVGFGVRIYSSERVCGGGRRRRKPPLMEVVDGVVKSGYVDYFRIRMCCRKEGKLNSKSVDQNRSVQSCRTGCNYLVTARRNPKIGNAWKITSVKSLHNHSLNIGHSRFLPRFRTISVADQLLILELNKARVSASKIYDFFLNKWKGYKKVPFCEIDLHNFIYLSNRKQMKDCDFALMEGYFKKMREESPGFYYDFDIDLEHRLKSVFWADARCRDAFEFFGDVVSFDTTFVSNRYRMPFAPFVGVNHHGKTMLFGCALLSSEDTDSFVWLFETWKKCMGGAPLRILTDQDRAIGKAVEIVFPNTTHRWCMWHAMKNCSKHLGMREDWEEMYYKLQNLLHDSFDVAEFECRWNEWVNEYEVGENSWVRDMYKSRSRWCPVYFKSDFWAGMSSTQRSEGMNHYFKGYVNLNTCLHEFVGRYAKAICKRIDDEERDDFEDDDRDALPSIVHAFEPIFEKLFTRSKFLEFHKELKQFSQTSARKVVDIDMEVVYEVLVKSFRVGWSKKSIYTVVFKKESFEAICECKNFEFRGILCAHALRVYWMEDTMEVPEKYVLDRWRKDIPRKYVTHIYPESTFRGVVHLPAKRFHEMKQVCEDLGTMVMNDENLHKEVLAKINQLKAEIHEKTSIPEGIGRYEKGTVGQVYSRVRVGETQDNRPVGSTVYADDIVKDPVDKRGRGRAPVKRKKSNAEKRGRSRGRGRSESGAVRNVNDPTPPDCSNHTPPKIVCRTWEGGPAIIAKNRKRLSFQMDSGTGNFS